MLSVLFVVFFSFLLVTLNYLFKYYNILIDKKELAHKSFTSKSLVPVSGGFLIAIYLLLSSNNYSITIFFILIFILGVFSDLLLIVKPLKKFILQFFIIIIFLSFSKISILSTKVFFIDFFIQNKIFATLFTCFCLLIIINGTNFLDGINTLVCGYYILIILTILYIGGYNKINYNFSDFFYLLLVLSVIFAFNFFSKTYLGDSGSFLLSFLIGCYLINLSNINLSLTKYMSPIFILVLLWYPAFENLFSIIRKLLSKKKPSEPDNFHFHHLLFSYLSEKIKNKKNVNSITAVIINFYHLLIFSLSTKFYDKTNILSYFVMINIFIYLLFYFFLLKKVRTIRIIQK
jgi:UDP-N-acetylmuramyl pentapeptide phosphotransferase/UDP-N-acetylglucosamine-1-phosphate transferase